MVQSEELVPLSDFERQLFTKLVPEDHFLRQLEPLIDFERFRPSLLEHYCPDMGRPPLDPVMMLKLDLSSMHYRWSDRELMRHAQVNMAVRLFLNMGCNTKLPHHTSMTYFRERVGADAIQAFRPAARGALISPGKRRGNCLPYADLPFSSFRRNPASHPQMPVRKSSIAVLSSRVLFMRVLEPSQHLRDPRSADAKVAGKSSAVSKLAGVEQRPVVSG
jgi:transposase